MQRHVALTDATRRSRAPCTGSRRIRQNIRAQLNPQANGLSQQQNKVKVVGCGSCGVDYLASVAAYPKPDEKLRTEMLEVQGGGNCANALTAAARLGLAPSILTKIGGDGLGDGIISELQGEGIDTSFIIREAGHPSPFTYIIVDRAGSTRTCIHTPGAPLDPSEVTPDTTDSILDGAALVYFDGRLTEYAIVLATRARERGIPVLVEAERQRPNLEHLLPLADYVITSTHFPKGWTGEEELGDALVEVLQRLPRARFVATTLGARGSLLLERPPAQEAGADAAEARSLVDVISSLQAELKSQPGTSKTACRSSNGIDIGAPSTTSTSAYLPLTFSQHRDGSAALEASRAAAERAAALNADSGNAARYAMAGQATTAVVEDGAGVGGTIARVTFATAASLPQEAVQDTTGAGDAFIGAALYCLATGKSPADILRLGAVVAACKCTALGARPGLPQRDALAAELL